MRSEPTSSVLDWRCRVTLKTLISKHWCDTALCTNAPCPVSSSYLLVMLISPAAATPGWAGLGPAAKLRPHFPAVTSVVSKFWFKHQIFLPWHHSNYSTPTHINIYFTSSSRLIADNFQMFELLMETLHLAQPTTSKCGYISTPSITIQFNTSLMNPHE